jgi:hypothetical protein
VHNLNVLCMLRARAVQVSVEEQKEYMCTLYERCLESKKKTEEELTAKYLQPLGKARKV